MATTPTTRKGPDHPQPTQTTTEALQQALRDLDQARQAAQGELRTQLDDAADRVRRAIDDVRDRAGDELHDMEESLDRASETLRVEIALRAIRAQRSTEALTQLSAAIRKRKAEITQP